MYLKINGFDITPYVVERGLKWQRNDVESPNAGRTLAGTMVRDRVAVKIRMDVKLIRLTSQQLRTILNLVSPEYFTVEYFDPMLGYRTSKFYSNNIPAGLQIVDSDGVEWWTEVSIPLVEV